MSLQRAYRALLRLLPFEFRAEFGRDMEQAFADEHDDLRSRRSVGETIGFALRTIKDFARTAPRQHWDLLRQDARLAARMLLRNRGFAATAIVTLALGIGGSAGIFSVVYGVVMRPLAFPESERVVRVGWTDQTRPFPYWVSYPDFEALKTRSAAFDLIGAMHLVSLSSEKGSLEVVLPNESAPGNVGQTVVGPQMASAAVFKLFGASTVMGRLPDERDEQPGAAPVAVLSYSTWTSHYGRDPGVIGRTLTQHITPVVKRDVTIVGVLEPDAFPAPNRTPAWSSFDPDLLGRDNRGQPYYNLTAYARLAPGLSLETAGAELAALSAQVAPPPVQYEYEKPTLRARTLRDEMVAPVRDPLMAFLWAVSSLLLVAAVNVASLVLARATSRRQEFAARFALGARPLRIARQLITESAMLAACAGVLGLVVAWVTRRAFVSISPEMPRLDQSDIGMPAVLFVLGGILLATCVAGLLPAIQASRRSVVDGLRRAGGAPTTATAFSRPLALLATTEVALVLVLLAGTGLLVHSFVRLITFDLGIDPRSVVVVTLNRPVKLAVTSYQPPNTKEGEQTVAILSEGQRRARLRDEDVIRRVSAIPGVLAVGVTGDDPFGPPYRYGERLRIGNSSVQERAAPRLASATALTALGLRMASGRWFTEQDIEGAPLVTVVNESMVRRIWNGRSPIGERVIQGRRSFEVIGVVADVRELGARQDVRPTFYLSTAQAYPEPAMLIVRTRPGIEGVDQAVAAELTRTGSEMSRLRRLKDIWWMQIADARFLTIVVSVFGLLALAVALVGVHGILRFLVTQRTRELGIRKALGATRLDLVALVLKQALRFTLPGCVVGLIGAVAAAPTVRSLVFGITPTDPVTLLAATGLLIAAVFVGAYFPARRASAVDPALSLRSE